MDNMQYKGSEPKDIVAATSNILEMVFKDRH